MHARNMSAAPTGRRTSRAVRAFSTTLAVLLMIAVAGCTGKSKQATPPTGSTAAASTAPSTAASIAPSSGTSASAPGASAAGAASTPWSTALGRISADGTFSKDAALTLFALAFGGMPGVETPAGPRGDIRSGTLALRSVLAHQSELTDAQRARVAEVRSIPDASAGVPIDIAGQALGVIAPVLLRATPGPTPPDADTRHLLEATAKQIRQDISARMGGDIPGVIRLVFDPRNDKDGNAGMADPVFPGGGHYAGCTMHLYPATFAPDKVPATTLAHEMVHCFQAAAYNNESAFYAAPSWLIEGSAEWAGAVLAGTDSLDVQLWEMYLAHPGTDLRTRKYDAIGFYAHMQETAHSPWAAFRKMWVAGQSSEASFAASGATDDSFLDTWAASTTRQRSLGKEWDTDGPGITADSPTREPLSVGKQAVAVSAAAYTQTLRELDISTDLVQVSVPGHGMLSDGNVDTVLSNASLFCTKDGGCSCPDGTGPDIPPVPLHKSGVGLALTGGVSGAKGSLQGLDLADICTPKSSATPLDACALVTDAEVMRILGIPLARHERHDANGFHSCIIGTARQPLAGMTMADVSYVSVGFGVGDLSMFHGPDSGPTTPLKGLGDRAEFVNGAGAVAVDKGSLVMTLQVVQAGHPAPQALVISVARIALARLG